MQDKDQPNYNIFLFQFCDIFRSNLFPGQWCQMRVNPNILDESVRASPDPLH